MFNQLRRSLPLFGSGLIFAITFSAVPAFAQLVGPKSAAELGITVGDSNPGSSREMGFSGGKIITYSNIDTTGYSGFQWGLAADGAKLSLDGPFTGADGETLVFRSDLSNLAQGVAVWSGISPIVNFTGSGSIVVEVETRLRLTVTTIGGGAPVPFNALGPRVDIFGDLLAGFEVRFETLAQKNGLTNVDPQCVVGTDASFPSFGPMLEVFDCATDASQDSQAFTSVFTGFFVEHPDQTVDLAPVLNALSAAEAKLDGIDSTGLGFVIEDWPLRWGGLSQDIGQLKSDGSATRGGIETLDSKLNALRIDVSNLPQEIRDQLPEEGDALTAEQFAFLFGVPIPPPEGFPPFDFVRDNALVYQLLDGITSRVDALEVKLEGVSAALEDQLAATEIDVEVILSKRGSVGANGGNLGYTEKVFIVLMKERGIPVDGEFSSVLAITDTNGLLTTTELGWSVSPIQVGLVQVVAELPNEMSSTKNFLIRISHDHDGNIHEGSKLVAIAGSDVN